jgi:DNA polymerase-3 subunit epsilon
MRQIVLDTETTGLESARGHRIIEVACVEMVNRRVTGRHFHQYLNPEREVDEGARAIHGMSLAQLADKPRFAEVAAELAEFISGSELIIHNAAFDVGFLDAEFARLVGAPPLQVKEVCKVLDTLLLAREMHPGQRNSLDALCKRYSVDNSHRDWHGALLDARLLADVYLAMTGGQSALAFAESSSSGHASGVHATTPLQRPAELRVVPASGDEMAAHELLLALIDKQSGGQCRWREATGG